MRHTKAKTVGYSYNNGSIDIIEHIVVSSILMGINFRGFRKKYSFKDTYIRAQEYII